jgi:predicted nucleotidyltransferase
MQLFELMMSLRAQAALIYDRAKVQGIPQDQIGDLLKPIASRLTHVVQQSAGDLEQCAQAIASFQGNAKMKREQASQLMEKAQEEDRYALQIEQALAQWMVERGLETIVVGSRFATLVRIDDHLSVTIR